MNLVRIVSVDGIVGQFGLNVGRKNSCGQTDGRKQLETGGWRTKADSDFPVAR